MQITIPELRKERVTFTIIGDSPFIMHKWSDKAKNEMFEKQQKKAKNAREARNPEEEMRACLYVISNGEAEERYGFPSVAFKRAAIRAANDAGMKMTDARRMFHVIGEFVEILGKPTMREDMVKLQSGTAMIRFRPEFKTWKAVVNVDYNAGVISPEQIINLFQLAGFGVGLGDWRPEKNGVYGMFHIEEGGK
jgi:hypothetical protein